MNELIAQRSDHWIVLEGNKANADGQSLSWDFMHSRPGKYDLQVISKGELTSPLPAINVEIAELQFSQAPQNEFVLDVAGEKQTVSQFRETITLRQTGKHSITIAYNAPIEQVRIIPHYRMNLGFGSGKYHKRWLEMHNSSEKQATLAWLKAAKYGMFIHWGIYSQAGGIWNNTRIEDSPYPGPRVAEWLMSTFRIPRKEYEQLAQEFKPDKSFAQNIARLAKDAGMKYVVITSKHHDGFALFNSECSNYNIVNRTPYKADAIKELYDACQNEELEFGVYYSHGNDWYDGSDGNYTYMKKRNDALGILSHPQGKNLWNPSPNTHTEYLENKAYPQITELLHLLPKLRLIWFDGAGYITEEQSFRFYKLIYDINPSVIVNRRVGYDFGDYIDAGDNVIPSATDALSKYWETCGTTNNSWGYKAYDNDWKSTRELLYYLIDIASKGGNYLLNIGPDGKGHVPEASARGLREVGQWLKANGEAIYGTTRWKIPHEGQGETLLEGTGHRAQRGFTRNFTPEDFWFTANGNKVYAIALVPPLGDVKIKSLRKANGIVEEVRLVLEFR